MNFVENCNICSKEVQVKDINGIINSDKSSRSYDDLYFGVTYFLGHRVRSCPGISLGLFTFQCFSVLCACCELVTSNCKPILSLCFN